ncbi:MAG: SDR family oxidoreductase [Opitutae bacterium]|jgi:NAD(P)-dependent dehydrogenase (short-subunit alcohol dehydrogenase family)|nr:SDR family oxidoreductase [Opitutae bacterium]MDG1300998.1 SDR family oxidoreductase [Opitutae bacterium]
MSGSDKFKNKQILVVGATGDLGCSIARHLKAEGAELVISGRNAEKLNALAQELGGDSLSVDLSDSAGRAQLVEAVGVLDGLVYAAGVAPVAPVRYLKDADLEACLNVNTTGPLLLVRDLLKNKKLNAGASIVWLSSVAAARGSAGYAAYAASKAGLEASARCLALELAPKRIRVNCMAPGMIETEMAATAAERISGEALTAHLKAYPLGTGQPADVAAAASFLLSESSRWVTGVTLPVDGGFSIQ